MKIDIYKDGISFITDEVSSVKISEANLNEENRIKFVTDLAAVSRGKREAKNPSSRYKALLQEAAPQHSEIMKSNCDVYTCPQCKKDCKPSKDTDIIVRCNKCKIMCDSVSVEQPDGYDISEWEYRIKGSPSRPLEFLPIFIKQADFIMNVPTAKGEGGFSKVEFRFYDEQFVMTYFNFINLIANHSYITKDGIYTNMRCLINSGMPYDSIPYNTAEELKDFKALRANIPMFAFNHLITHTALSKEAQSDRVTKNGKYWLPADLRERAYKYINSEDNTYENVYSEFTDISKNLLKANPKHTMVDKLLSLSQNTVQSYFKALHYKKEIYQRAMLEFRYKEVVMTAWYNNPKTLQHFLTEREAYPEVHKSWVQEQTRLLAIAMKDVVES